MRKSQPHIETSHVLPLVLVCCLLIISIGNLEPRACRGKVQMCRGGFTRAPIRTIEHIFRVAIRMQWRKFWRIQKTLAIDCI